VIEHAFDWRKALERLCCHPRAVIARNAMKTKVWVLLSSLLFGVALLRAGAAPGDLVWTNHLGGSILGGPAETPEGIILLGSDNGSIYAYNKDGTPRWSEHVGNDVLTTPAIGPDGMIYVGVDDNMVALTPDGAIKWQVDTGDKIHSAPALAANGTVFFGSSDNSLYAVTQSGTVLWTFLTQGSIHSSPAVGADGTLYFGSRDNRLYAVSSTGRLLWWFDTEHNIDSSPALGAAGVVYFGADNGKVYALNSGGLQLWEYRLPHGTPTSPVLAPDGTLYVSSSKGQLHAVNPLGQLLWTWEYTNQVGLSSPIVTLDGTLYVASADGKAHSLSALGKRNWSVKLSSTMEQLSFNLASDGALLLGTDAGDLVYLRGAVGPARIAWPMQGREPTHNASSFVQRRLAAQYSPGLIQVATLDAYPPVGVGNYVVEDQPPAGWAVGTITHGGQYDAASGKVKFGPFLDTEYRRLQYELVPPLRESADKYFSSIVAAGVWSGACLGDVLQKALPLHPGDLSPVDGRVTLAETVAFSIAWLRNLSWPAGPSPIPASYVDKATELWRRGEYYGVVTNSPAPAMWINALDGPRPVRLTTNEVPVSVLNGSVGTAFCQMSNAFQPGQLIPVTIQVSPAGGTFGYALEDSPPAGWTVSQISSNGVWDPVSKKVKWGPFNDGRDRRLTYQVKVSAAPTNVVTFDGMACFNGTNTPIIGQRLLTQGTPTDPWVKRESSGVFAPLWSQTITLSVLPPPEITQYYVDEIPPPGWSVDVLSPSGAYDAAHHVIRFGPFFDATPLVLTYEVTPPSGATGTNTFVGRIVTSQGEALVGGPSTVTEIPLHPCDQNPVDSVISLTEALSYASVWKSGSNWSQKPNPIPPSYASKASGLWLQGEAYRYTTNAPALPQRWQPDTNHAPWRLDGLNTNFATATGCVAQAMMPSTWIEGQMITVELDIEPTNNVLVYAVEEVPPENWAVQGISDDGLWDGLTGKIKWGPFFDHAPRTLRYEVVPPAGVTCPVNFVGLACFDRRGLVINGSRQLRPLLPARLEAVEFQPDTGFALRLLSEPGQRYDVQKTADFDSWQSWLTTTNSTNSQLLRDTDATNQSPYFYRAISK
jgi:outer membrane protein assembly factor BamB